MRHIHVIYATRPGDILNGTSSVMLRGWSMETVTSTRWMVNTIHFGGGVRWDLLIAFPPCTYLTNAGALRLLKDEHDGQFQMVNVERLKKGIKARDFFLSMLGADCEHIAVENPFPMSIFCMPQATQTIQPFQFGHPYLKKTCLWLKNLPCLRPTELVEPKGSWVSGGSKRADGTERRNKGTTFRDSKRKSKTFDGVAQAMAEQWSDIERYRDDEQPELF